MSIGNYFNITVTILIVGIIACDLGTFLHAGFGRVGAALWFLSLFLLYGYGLFHFLRSMRGALSGKGTATCLVALIFIATLVGGALQEKSYNQESVHETGCAVSQLVNRPDAGFHGTCHFGYPTRGYYLATVPSFLWERSARALNLGMALYLILGIVLYAAFVPGYLGGTSTADWISALSLCLLPLSYVFVETTFNFEQVLLPTAWALCMCGLWSRFEKHGDERALSLLSLVALHVAITYTPALPLLPLELAALGVWILRRRPRGTALLRAWGGIAAGALAFALSLTYRGDIRLFQPFHPNPAHNLEGTLGNLSAALALPYVAKYGPPSVYFELVMIVLVAAGGFFVRRNFAVALWSVAIVIAGMLVGGVTYLGGGYGTFRCVGIVPVLVWSLAAVLRELAGSAPRWRAVIAGTAILALVVGAFNVRMRLSNKSIPLRLQLMMNLKELIPASFWKEGFVFILPAQKDFRGTYSYFGYLLDYYAPGSTMEKEISHCRLPMDRFPRQIRLAHPGYHCPIPGPSKELGRFTFLKVEHIVEELLIR